MSPTGAARVLGILYKQMTSELGTSKITVKVHREDARNSTGVSLKRRY
jgi:FixJ family two-component response regulator